jgi:thymidylate kinase
LKNGGKEMGLIINLFGVPGAGKSTGAAYIFSQLKMKGINCELVTEFAKDKVWENTEEVFKNQAYIFGKQSFKISRCADKVDVVITDSPLPLSIFYNHDERLTENFNNAVMDFFNSYDNVNYFLKRTKPYNASGRLQTEEESDRLAQPMMELFRDRSINIIQANGDIGGYEYIVNDIMWRLYQRGIVSTV